MRAGVLVHMKPMKNVGCRMVREVQNFPFPFVCSKMLFYVINVVLGGGGGKIQFSEEIKEKTTCDKKLGLVVQQSSTGAHTYLQTSGKL